VLHSHPCPIADQDGTVAAALFECSAPHSGVPAEEYVGDDVHNQASFGERGRPQPGRRLGHSHSPSAGDHAAAGLGAPAEQTDDVGAGEATQGAEGIDGTHTYPGHVRGQQLRNEREVGP